jgi:hypothetical protein
MSSNFLNNDSRFLSAFSQTTDEISFSDVHKKRLLNEISQLDLLIEDEDGDIAFLSQFFNCNFDSKKRMMSKTALDWSLLQGAIYAKFYLTSVRSGKQKCLAEMERFQSDQKISGPKSPQEQRTAMMEIWKQSLARVGCKLQCADEMKTFLSQDIHQNLMKKISQLTILLENEHKVVVNLHELWSQLTDHRTASKTVLTELLKEAQDSVNFFSLMCKYKQESIQKFEQKSVPRQKSTSPMKVKKVWKQKSTSPMKVKKVWKQKSTL